MTDVEAPDWETWELPIGGVASEILLRWGGHGGDIEKVVDFARATWDEDPAFWSRIWSRPSTSISPEERRRVADAWDRWRA